MKKFMKNKMDMSSLKELERKQEMKAATPVLSDLPTTTRISTPVDVKSDNTNIAPPAPLNEQRPILQPIPGQPPLPLDPPPPDSPKIKNVKKEIEDAEYDLPTNTTETSTEIDLKPKLEVIQSDDNAANKPPPLCRDFVRGTCIRPGTCKFSHEFDVNQLVGVYTFCRNFQNSVCTYPNCRYVHATVFEEQKFYRTGILPAHAFNHHKKTATPTPTPTPMPTPIVAPLQPPPPPPPEETPVTATITSQFMPPVVSTSQMMTMPTVSTAVPPTVTQMYNVPAMAQFGTVPPEMQFSMPPPNMASNNYNLSMLNNMAPSTSFAPTQMQPPSTSFAPTQMQPPNTNAGRSDTNLYDFSNTGAQMKTRSPEEEIKDCRNCKFVKLRLVYFKNSLDSTAHELSKAIKKNASITRKKNKLFSLIVAMHNKPSNKMTMPDNTRLTQDKNPSLASILAKLKDS